jgi:sulfide dehydrogenase cytochrome subunit
MNSNRFFPALAVGLALVIPAHAEISGRMLANTCSGCHGVQGVSAGPSMPTLAGMPRDFILAAMQQFRDGSRASTIMGRIAKGYNDKQLGAMSDFLSQQPWGSAPQSVDANLVRRGQKLHTRRCEVCHRESGASTALDMPRMAGQWATYIRMYMDSCRDPKWNTRHPNAMTDLCGDLAEEDITALAHFYAAQK